MTQFHHMHPNLTNTKLWRLLSSSATSCALSMLLISTPAGAQTSRQLADSALTSLKAQPEKVLPESQEAAIGSVLAASLLSDKTLDADSNAQRYINQLGRWLSLQSTQPRLAWSFAVVDDSSVNAWSAPGGYVFVTRGLFDLCADEAELAGVLAREIVLVANRYPLQKLASLAQASPYAPISTLAQQLTDKPYTDDVNYLADREAVVLAARSGIDPYGLAVWLYKAADLVDKKDSGLNQWQSQLPPVGLRIDQLQQAMGNQLDAHSGKPPVSIADRLAMPQARIQSTPPQASPTPTRRNRRK